MKGALSIGHHADQPGKLLEFSECAAIAGLISKFMRPTGHSLYMIGSGPLEKKIAEVNAGDFDFGLEIHLNAGGGSGCETLYCPGSAKGKLLAMSVQSALVNSLEYRDRGVKEGWYRMDRPGHVDYPGDVDGDENLDAILKMTNCPFIIPEPFFLDDPKGVDTSVANYERIALAVALGLFNFYS